MKIVGFSFLRNAVKYDYPFRESLASLASLVDEIVLAVGKSEDDTLERIRELKLPCALHVLETEWNEANRKSGLVLSEQTNLALAEVRRRHPRAWAFYLQGDELLHEREHARIRADLAEADATNAAAVRFRYLHFWQRPDQIAIGKRWYPQEIRALRTDSQYVSYGDAQSFHGGGGKIFESDAFIYHYGHVREPAAYAAKKRDFHRWWHSDQDIPEVVKRGEASDAREKCLAYYGPHPQAIVARLYRLFGEYPPVAKRDLLLFGNPADYSENFRSGIGTLKLRWTQNSGELLRAPRGTWAALAPLPISFQLRTLFRYRSQVPRAMESPEARPWTKEFRALLQLSERAVPCRSTGLD